MGKSVKSIPILETERLILRPFALSDAESVRSLAGDYEVASTTLFIPHPYEAGMAEKWISGHQIELDNALSMTFAMTLKTNNSLIGAIALSNFDNNSDTASLGYWIGKPYWNTGYCSEAGRRVLQLGFNELQLNRIFAHHLKRNPASGRVMQKIGMTHEGCMRQHVKKWDIYEDLEYYGILKNEFNDQLSDDNS